MRRLLGAAAPYAILLAFLYPRMVHAQATVTVNAQTVLSTVTTDILGMNMAVWYSQEEPGLADFLRKGGIKTLRYPGGSMSDAYHWATNTICEQSGGGNPHATFADFENNVALPGKFDVAVTVNYGSNSSCSGGGDPAEAASWVAYAKANKFPVTHWTVGNEVYGSWEYDLHTTKNDATTYANAVSTGFYPQMKAANPRTSVGVVVNPHWTPAWDTIVLNSAPYDFVEYHFYPEQAGQENDAFLVGAAAQILTQRINSLKSELASAGHPNTPIYVGEIGSVSAGFPGKQTTSITQALYAGQVLGELMNDGISRATWWVGFGGCSQEGDGGNWSPSLYGWQNFGGYMTWSDGLPDWDCPNVTPTPLGTMLPTARAYELFSKVLHNGEHALSVTLGGQSTDLRAYAVTEQGGIALVLFNVNETMPIPVTIAVAGMAAASATTVSTYDKARYDKSQTGVWAGFSQQKFGAQALPQTLTISPWSMNVVTLAQ